MAERFIEAGSPWDKPILVTWGISDKYLPQSVAEEFQRGNPDFSFISGIGNWMADEVLYQARIHPLQIASSMSKESCATLLKCINEVIEKAVEVGADSSQFPSNWIFHSREKKLGKAFVDGKKIEFITAGGRTSAYVPELQKLTGNQAAKAVGKSSNSVDESENEEATDSRKSKVPRGRKPTVKKPSSNRKSKGSDDESNNDEDDDNDDDKSLKKTRGGKNPPPRSKPKGTKENDDQKKKTKGRKTTAKRKTEETDDEDDAGNASGSGDDNDNEEDQKVMDKKRGKAGALSKGKVGSGQNGKQRKKMAK
ncbi:formamidopyrimidine-DNA glycosylase [Abeliophyllum distichum]|uniref:Formamidopyrimidine-DNA glycosylase n=1 Tax=Abeliophyllum distichum TaxID=126358 RepID=A0ABD1NS66_9LAMI